MRVASRALRAFRISPLIASWLMLGATHAHAQSTEAKPSEAGPSATPVPAPNMAPTTTAAPASSSQATGAALPPSAAPAGASGSSSASATAASTSSGTAGSTPAPSPTPGASEAEPPWYSLMKVGAFVDTYYSQNWNGPKPQADANTFHPYNNNAGFGLAWVGLDTAIDTGSVGGALQLRFGPSVPNLALGDFKVPGGIGYVQNGYATWKPGGTGGRLTLLAGKFDTVYGAEVAQSYLNMNYTRGALYNLAQPFFHTGVRADWQATDQLALKLMAVNGWNNTIDNNRGKSFGTQVTYTPSDVFAMSVGYMGGPEGSDTEPVSGGGLANVPDANGELRHLVDVVVDVKPTSDLRIVANADYVADKTKGASTSWYGASLLGRYAFSSMFAAALRGEYIADKNGVLTATQKDTSLVTGTLTLEATPSKYLVLRLDNRIDVASEEVYKVGIDSTSGTMFTTTLGVVAKTN